MVNDFLHIQVERFHIVLWLLKPKCEVRVLVNPLCVSAAGGPMSAKDEEKNAEDGSGSFFSAYPIK